MGFSFSGQQAQPIPKDNCTVCMWSRLHGESRLICIHPNIQVNTNGIAIIGCNCGKVQLRPVVNETVNCQFFEVVEVEVGVAESEYDSSGDDEVVKEIENLESEGENNEKN